MARIVLFFTNWLARTQFLMSLISNLVAIKISFFIFKKIRRRKGYIVYSTIKKCDQRLWYGKSRRGVKCLAFFDVDDHMFGIMLWFHRCISARHILSSYLSHEKAFVIYNPIQLLQKWKVSQGIFTRWMFCFINSF